LKFILVSLVAAGICRCVDLDAATKAHVNALAGRDEGYESRYGDRIKP
jgi:aromatic ring hydroxylase